MESVRLDKWLCAARFFKTRTLASEAAAGGHVEIAGHRAKPSRPIRIGDRLRIVKAPFITELVVVGLAPRRLSAPLAAALYEETPESAAGREKQAALLRANHDPLLGGRSLAPGGPRPTKRDRRNLDRLGRG